MGTVRTAVKVFTPGGSPAERGGTSADSAHLQPAGVGLAAAGADRAGTGGSGDLYRFREQLLLGATPTTSIQTACMAAKE